MPMYYQIKVKGHLDSTWSDWFDGLAITHIEHGESLIHGPITDQAALHGMLNRVRDLGLILIGVCQVPKDSGEES